MYRHLAGATLGTAAAISIGCSDGTGPGLSPLPTQPLVFMRVRSTFSNIVRVNPDGTGETTLTNSGADAYPSWSPDDKHIAYFLLRQEWTDVYVMDADGSNQRVVLRAAAVGVAQNAEPAWSPDQQWLAYPKAFSLVRIRLDGTGERVITGGAAAPSWSPDGQRIALALNGGIAVSNLDGTDRRPVVAPGVDPAWSPDGRRLAYAAGDRGASFIYTVNVDGTEIRRVTTPTTDSTKTTDLSPAWSPDGRWIAFQREHGCVSLLYCIGSWDIFVTRADGTDLRKVTTDGNSVRPSW